MRCPYNDMGCPFVDTLYMVKDKDCQDCEFCHNGVRATGATPVLGFIIELLKKIFK